MQDHTVFPCLRLSAQRIPVLVCTHVFDFFECTGKMCSIRITNPFADIANFQAGVFQQFFRRLDPNGIQNVKEKQQMNPYRLHLLLYLPENGKSPVSEWTAFLFARPSGTVRSQRTEAGEISDILQLQCAYKHVLRKLHYYGDIKK